MLQSSVSAWIHTGVVPATTGAAAEAKDSLTGFPESPSMTAVGPTTTASGCEPFVTGTGRTGTVPVDGGATGVTSGAGTCICARALLTPSPGDGPTRVCWTV